MPPAKKEIKVTLEKTKETKRFVAFAVPDEDGTADIRGSLYVRKGTDRADAEKLTITIK
jgi:hypothetical protein